jgi:serine protein kinase
VTFRNLARKLSNRDQYKVLNWHGSFEEYLTICHNQPHVTRNAFQRVYDMIMSWGTEELVRYKRPLVRYKFFQDPIEQGKDAVFGLEEPLQRLVGVLKSAAEGFGTEKRVILLHGPVGSAKSTVSRMLKKGIEHYSRTDDGALYTFQWRMSQDDPWEDSPMHEEPLKLVPAEVRREFVQELFKDKKKELRYPIDIVGELDPASRYNFKLLLEKYDGDWWSVLENHVRVRRLLLSEKDRVGIGTFQPKDEKNQDSTELTGDINYRKIAVYGSDSDPRAFNFDGEFNVANRGIIEFIEILKLDVAFLYDLLGATQEHKIKPKKFAQTDIDEVIVGHSVAGSTPIAYRHDGRVAWTTLEGLHARFGEDATGLEVLAHDFSSKTTRWVRAKQVIRHPFSGRMLTTSQKWGAVETTPNHSIYGRDGETFFPDDKKEAMAVRAIADATLVEPREALQTIDVVAGIPGFVRDEALVTTAGGVMTRPPRAGWARLGLPRHATEVRAIYDPVTDSEALKDLITLLVWYATEGHINGRNGGLVITQANPAELERVRRAYANVTTGEGSIDAGAKTDSCWRLYCGSQAVAALAEHHCGRGSANKRLPDFLFSLPRPFLQHAFDELMRTDGTRTVPPSTAGKSGEDYAASFFDYKTISPMLAAQVGTLATLLGHDYSVYRNERPGKPAAYRVRYCNPAGKKGGRLTKFTARLHERVVTDELVYDIECEGLHNFVCGVGNIVCHNTNEPEYRKLQSNELMEAFRDRTVKIDIPYITTLSDEIRIYEKDFNAAKVKGKFIAPHTVQMAAMWAVLTRLEEPKNASLSLLQKLKLYNGKTLPGFTEDNIQELREAAPREGMHGISPRYVQDKISNALVSDQGSTVNPFMVMNELEEGLRHHSLIASEELKKHYKDLLAVVKEEYEDIVKNEVQKAISADEDAIARLCANYVDNVKAYTQREKVKNKYTGQDEEPDERLMRSIEEKIDIPESRKDDFRREIMNYIGALAIDGKQFHYWTNERLQKALELKLFEDQKDSIKLKNLVSNVIDKETQEKIDVVKARLIKNYGYNDESATDVLNFVASIFARGDAVRSSS